MALKDVLEAHVRPGRPLRADRARRLHCYACGHNCPIPDGAAGVCKVRFNRGGTLYVPWGYVGGVQCDPIEKKPFFHAMPGALAFSFGMLGCDLHCSYCQNWVTSQALRDPEGRRAADGGHARAARRGRPRSGRPRRRLDLQRAVDHRRVGGRDLSRSARRRSEDRVRLERQRRHRACSSTCGRTSTSTRSISSRSTIGTTASWADGSTRSSTRSAGSTRMGLWLEIVTLLIPGFNDSRRRDRPPHGVHRRRVARHPVARHRVPSGLPHDRSS